MPSPIDNLWTTAMQEAITLAPSDDVILHTIELRIPTASSGLVVVRCVLDHGGLLEDGNPPIYGHVLTLENDAPVDAGQSVTFVACMFDMALPEQKDTPPSIEITVDNVTQVISPYLDDAVGQDAAIEVTYREYLLSDPTQPQYLLPTGMLQKVVSTLTRIKATVVFTDLVNSNFPSLVYQPTDYVSLTK